MSALFDRKVRVTFGPRTEKRATQIDELFMQFDIKKSLEAEPSSGTIEITNMAPSSRAVLEQKDVWLRLQAGYNNASGAPNLGNLFLGRIKKSATERHGKDAVTSIEVVDGIDQWQTANISRTLAPGSTTKQLFEALASEFGLGIGSVKGITEQIYQQGVTVFGPIRLFMDDLMKKMNLEWSIVDNNLVVLARNVASEKTAIVISPNTGLIESPIPREDDKTGGKFVEFKCLIRPGMNPGVAVKLESKRTTGFFKLRRIHYKGDNRKGPFEASCEAIELGAVDPGSSPLNVDLSKVLKPNL